jgi:hypothetical protein
MTYKRKPLDIDATHRLRFSIAPAMNVFGILSSVCRISV